MGTAGIYELDSENKTENKEEDLSIEEKMAAFIDRLNKAVIKVEMEGREGSINEIAAEMGYKGERALIQTAWKHGLNTLELYIIAGMDIKRKKSSYKRKMSLESLTKCISLKLKANRKKDPERRVIEVIKKVKLILLDLTQDKSVRYTNIKDIESNIDNVVKGIFEDFMFDLNGKIFNSAMNSLELYERGKVLRELKIMEEYMKEVKKKIEDHIFKLVDEKSMAEEKLIPVIARLPRYTLVGGEQDEPWDTIEEALGSQEAYFIKHIIGEHIKNKGRAILDNIAELNKMVKDIEDYLEIEYSLSREITIKKPVDI